MKAMMIDVAGHQVLMRAAASSATSTNYDVTHHTSTAIHGTIKAAGRIADDVDHSGRKCYSARHDEAVNAAELP